MLKLFIGIVLVIGAELLYSLLLKHKTEKEGNEITTPYLCYINLTDN